jgi:L-fuculose-phosphate aldolase
MTEPTSARVAEAREAICEIGRRCWQRGLVAANDGNISVRLGEQIICTPSGVSKGFMEPAQLALVGLDGEVLDGGPAPSSEVKMHLRIYQDSPTATAVVHTHPLYATMWAIVGKPISAKMLPETIITMPEVPLAPYATPSTRAVPDSIAGFVNTHQACLLEHHGALTWAENLEQAYLLTERLEYTAQITWLLERSGQVRELPSDEVERLHQIFG